MKMSVHKSFPVLVFVIFMVTSCGCDFDPDSGWKQSTREQANEIRSGEDHNLFHPYPNLLVILCRDPTVARNLREVILMQDLAKGGYAALADFPNLNSVVLYSTRSTDEFLTLLPACKSVKQLCIDTTDLTDAGLEKIGKMSALEELSIISYGENLTTKGFQSLAELESLKEIYLRVGPSSLDLESLQELLPSCNIELEIEQ